MQYDQRPAPQRRAARTTSEAPREAEDGSDWDSNALMLEALRAEQARDASLAPAAAVGGKAAKAATLQRGSSGAEVQALQDRLVHLGFLSAEDYKTGPGTYGKRTEAAVQRFQIAFGLEPDGRLDGASAEALTGATAQRASTQAAVEEKGANAWTRGVAGAGLKEGSSGDGVAALQEALIALGLLGADVRKTGLGTFGPRTVQAVQAFQRSQGIDAEGIYGPRTAAALREALGQTRKGHGEESAEPPKDTNHGGETTSKLDTWDTHAPTADYHRQWFRGVEINKRTRELIQRAEYILQHELGYSSLEFSFSQGSYNTGVEASAGTHDGGGALDLRTRGLSRNKVDAMVEALRMAGFAAWSRGRGHDSFSPHIHAIAIGDKEAAWLAKQQMQDYAKGRNGLSNHARDPDRALGRDMPTWAKKKLGLKV